MFDRISKLFKSSTVVAVLLLSGCGGGSPTTANGGSITINPTATTWTVTPVACGGPYNYHEVVITVFNAKNVPVANQSISVTLDLTAGTFTDIPRMYLYDDPTWVGDANTPPTTAPVGGSYTTSTTSDGTKRLIVGVDLGCTYKGNLNVYSGALFQTATFEVKS